MSAIQNYIFYISNQIHDNIQSIESIFCLELDKSTSQLKENNKNKEPNQRMSTTYTNIINEMNNQSDFYLQRYLNDK